MSSDGLKKRSLSLAGHRTSVSLELDFWVELERLADKRGLALAALIAEVDGARSQNLASALRLYVLAALKEEKP